MSRIVQSDFTLRAPLPEELAAASELCLRSKGYWGYDENFLEQCRDELTLTQDDLRKDAVIIALKDGIIAGVGHVAMDVDNCFLEKLFVDPAQIGTGLGRILFQWCVDAAQQMNVQQIIVEADPDAARFYEHMGCKRAGSVKSSSISGRSLPRLVFQLM